MNASIQEPTAIQPHAATNAFGFGSKFKLLLRREFWENKGGFFWAPIVTGIIASVFATVGMIVATIFIQKAKSNGDFTDHFKLDDVDGFKALGAFGDGVLANGIFLSALVMIFVVFFYALGSLYDERRDRSVLFWKSMPVSDLETVLSKLVFAVAVAPAFMLAAMALSQIVLLLVAGLMVMLKGASAWKLIWAHTNPFPVWGQLIAVQGVQALYLLPLYGWLMLAGSFARGKPFLWAVLPPVIFAIMESFVGFTTHFSISKVIWEFILRRLAAGTAPITFSADMGEGSMQAGYAGTRFAANFGDVIGRLGTADLWIGVAIGVAFLAGAVWLRRYRDESTS